MLRDKERFLKEHIRMNTAGGKIPAMVSKHTTKDHGCGISEEKPIRK